MHSSFLGWGPTGAYRKPQPTYFGGACDGATNWGTRWRNWLKHAVAQLIEASGGAIGWSTWWRSWLKHAVAQLIEARGGAIDGSTRWRNWLKHAVAQLIEAHGGAIDWSTALQAGSSRGLVCDFLLTQSWSHYGPGVDSLSNRNGTSGILWG